MVEMPLISVFDLLKDKLRTRIDTFGMVVVSAFDG
jgi:hypothetical protein